MQAMSISLVITNNSNSSVLLISDLAFKSITFGRSFPFFYLSLFFSKGILIKLDLRALLSGAYSSSSNSCTSSSARVCLSANRFGDTWDAIEKTCLY